jgi:integrase
MIDAATELDATPEARTAGRRALIATLVYAGLRIGEATALTWQDIDLANGRISVGDAKTEAGIRLVDILPALRDELTSHRHANAGAAPSDLVFPTRRAAAATRTTPASASSARSSRTPTSCSHGAAMRRCRRA